MLQPTMFMQTLDNGWNVVLEHGCFSVPYSKQAKASYVDYRDVAAVAAKALMGDELSYGHGQPCGTCGDDERGAWAYH